MKKINILSVLLLLLTGSMLITACGNKATETTQAATESDEENIDTDIVTLDDITKKAIQDAFAEDGCEITWYDSEIENSKWWGLRCYGDFDGCIVLFLPGDLTVKSETTVADSKFENSSSFGLYGYYEGELYTLSEAYENGYISKEEVAVAAERHRTAEMTKTDPLSEEMKKQIVEDYVAYRYGVEYDPKVNGIFQIERYYGSYDGAVAVTLTGSRSAYCHAMYTDIVAGIEIVYSYYNFIKVWKDGSFYTMQEAYDQEILTAEQVAEIANYRYVEYPIEY